jgi:hypothetical protein
MFAKRMASIHYFLKNTTASYMAFICDDALIYVRNLIYLFDWIEERHVTSHSHLLLGNCMGKATWHFLQGGSAWAMSRYTAEVLWENRLQGYKVMKSADDWDFPMFCRELNISIPDSTSEFIIGQYIRPEDDEIMESRRFEDLPNCMNEKVFHLKPRHNDCHSFLSRWNRVVFLHRVSALDWNCTRLPPVYECPDELYWWMDIEWPVFCMKRANWTRAAGIQ